MIVFSRKCSTGLCRDVRRGVLGVWGRAIVHVSPACENVAVLYLGRGKVTTLVLGRHGYCVSGQAMCTSVIYVLHRATVHDFDDYYVLWREEREYCIVICKLHVSYRATLHILYGM